MHRHLEGIRKVIDLVLKWTSAGLLGTMATVIFLQVIFRYALEAPLAWSEELARFLFVWVTFVGGALAAIRGGHISVEVVVDRLGFGVRRLVQFVSFALTAFFFGSLAYLTITVFPKLLRQHSPGMGLAMGYPYLGIVIGSGLMCVFYAIYAVNVLRGGNETLSKEGDHVEEGAA